MHKNESESHAFFSSSLYIVKNQQYKRMSKSHDYCIFFPLIIAFIFENDFILSIIQFSTATLCIYIFTVNVLHVPLHYSGHLGRFLWMTSAYLNTVWRLFGMASPKRSLPFSSVYPMNYQCLYSSSIFTVLQFTNIF